MREKTRLTRIAIGEALIRLLDSKSFDQIKIGEIAREAGISRVTYYHYYHSKKAVLEDYLNELVEGYLRESREKDTGEFREYSHLLHALQYFDRHRRFVMSLVKAGFYSMLMDAFNDYVREQVLPRCKYSHYELYYYVGALANLFIQWQLEGRKVDAAQLAHIILNYYGKEEGNAG